jgi:hypothetical protein
MGWEPAWELWENRPMAYLQVTFVVEAESEAQFLAELDEEAVSSALPGKAAWLMWVEEKHSIPDAVRAKWRKLRKPRKP